jgi:hypothetical protein
MSDTNEEKPKPKPPTPSKPNNPGEKKGGESPGEKATMPRPQAPEALGEKK